MQCAIDASQAAGSAGGAAGGVLGAGAAMLGFNRVGAWLAAGEFRFVTPRRLKVAGPIIVWTAFVAFYSIRF